MNYKEIAEAFFNVSGNLRQACIDELKKLLETQYEKTIELDDLDELDYYGMDVITITYDGGNNPEYASNVCSQVESVKLDNNGKIIIYCEDGEMNETTADVRDLYTVCERVETLIQRRIDDPYVVDDPYDVTVDEDDMFDERIGIM